MQESELRIPETQRPWLIPEVMAVDQDTKHAICDGTNDGRCREADAYLRKEATLSERSPIDPHTGEPRKVNSGTMNWGW